MTTCDIILAVLGVIAFIPFVVIILGGAASIASEMLLDIVKTWSKQNEENNTK